MAKLDSDHSATYHGGTSSQDHQINDSRKTQGNVRRFFSTYTVGATTPSADDYVQLLRIRKGDMIDVSSLKILAEAGVFGSITVDVGFEYDDSNLTDDPDGLIDGAAFNPSSSGTTNIGTGATNATLLTGPYEFAGSGWLTLMFKAVTGATSAKKLVVVGDFISHI